MEQNRLFMDHSLFFDLGEHQCSPSLSNLSLVGATPPSFIGFIKVLSLKPSLPSQLQLYTNCTYVYSRLQCLLASRYLHIFIEVGERIFNSTNLFGVLFRKLFPNCFDRTPNIITQLLVISKLGSLYNQSSEFFPL